MTWAVNLNWGLLHAGLQSVLDTALDAVIVMNVDGVIVGWNDHARASFGWSRDEAIGKRLSEKIVPPALRDAHERGLAHYLATGEGPVLDKRIEITALHRDGQEFPVELSITASKQFGDHLFVGFLRDISERQAVAERQQRLLQESDHRVKNMLTVVTAIAQQTARNAKDLEDFTDRFSARLQALAISHGLLAKTDSETVPLSALAEQVLGADVVTGRARYGGPDIQLGPQQVLGMSMILHELYTNAIKYGALCTDKGSIELDWTLEDSEVMVRWAERGHTCELAGGTGFGERMIAMSVKSDLRGTIERDWRPDGLTAVMRFPLSP